MSIRERLSEIQERIAAHAGGRAVTLVAASKYVGVDGMLEAYRAGVRHFGENRIQDALAKQAQWPSEIAPDVRWHFIGQLQINKVTKTVGRLELIHSVDSVRLAERIAHHNGEAGATQNVLLQVNLSHDATRHGFPPEALPAAMETMLTLPGLACLGLMTVAPPEASLSGDETELRRVFSLLATWRDRLERDFTIRLPELSMGMSRDYVHALTCGATIIRIGNDLFKNESFAYN